VFLEFSGDSPARTWGYSGKDWCGEWLQNILHFSPSLYLCTLSLSLVLPLPDLVLWERAWAGPLEHESPCGAKLNLLSLSHPRLIEPQLTVQLAAGSQASSASTAGIAVWYKWWATAWPKWELVIKTSIEKWGEKIPFAILFYLPHRTSSFLYFLCLTCLLLISFLLFLFLMLEWPQPVLKPFVQLLPLAC
jgi:hypothetical protein